MSADQGAGATPGVSTWEQDLDTQAIGEEELRQLAAELRQSNADLFRSNQELDSFAYIASHDLKEPLRGIHNYATFLLEDYTDKLDSEGRSKLDTLKVLAERMYSLIDSLLEYSRVGRVDLAIKKTDLSIVLEEVLLNHCGCRSTNGACRFEFPRLLPMIHVRSRADRRALSKPHYQRDQVQRQGREMDRDRLAHHVLRSNLWRATTAATSSEPGSIVFTVRDNGIGIQSRHLESIFRIFKRLHATRQIRRRHRRRAHNRQENRRAAWRPDHGSNPHWERVQPSRSRSVAEEHIMADAASDLGH